MLLFINKDKKRYSRVLCAILPTSVTLVKVKLVFN
jgi:hypothetical protein